MILGATGIITIVVVAGAVRGIAGFISHSGTQLTSYVKETQKKEDSQEVPAEQQGPSAMEQAKLLAAQYDLVDKQSAAIVVAEKLGKKEKFRAMNEKAFALGAAYKPSGNVQNAD